MIKCYDGGQNILYCEGHDKLMLSLLIVIAVAMVVKMGMDIYETFKGGK